MRERRVYTRKKTKRITFRMVRTLKFVFGGILLCFVLLSVVLFLTSKVKGDAYEKRVLAQQSYVSDVIQYRRGDVLDRNDNKLATSIQVYNMIIAPATILDKDTYLEPTLKALNSVFGVESAEITKWLDEKPESQYVMMKDYKNLDSAKVEEFEALQKKNKLIQGVWFEEDYNRQYPYSTVGCDVIGFSESNNTASWGIEGYYNDELNGSYGRKYGYYDSELNLVRTVKPAVDGNTIVSTIDVNVQGITEDCIAQFQEETGSKNMAVIIMNPQNGEIYAMASDPVFDLNNPRDLSSIYEQEELDAMCEEMKRAARTAEEKKKLEELSEEEKKLLFLSKLWRNYCISDVIEPGSTFKPITVAAALDEGKANKNTTFICDGGEQAADRFIRCVNRMGHGEMNLSLSLEKSCNDVMMQLASSLGSKTFYKYVRSFNFGRRTGIDLPGEEMGLIFELERLGPTELATSSFGQGQSVTMIQVAAAFSAVINGGNYYTPHVVKEIRNESGAVVQAFDDMLVRKTVTGQTSELIREYLHKTVEEGTASPAKVSGYSVGGKTGTAEKYPRGEDRYLVSFIGFTPVDDPQVVVYVVIDEPNVEDQAHSTYATEFASSLMKKVLPLLGVYADEELGNSSKEEDGEDDITLPSTSKTPNDETAPEGGFFDGDTPMAGEGEISSGDEKDDEVSDSPDPETSVSPTPEPSSDASTPDPDTAEATPTPTPEPSETPEMSQHSTTEVIH